MLPQQGSTCSRSHAHLADVGEFQGLPHGEVGNVLVNLVHQGDCARHIELAPAVPVVPYLAPLAQVLRLVQPPCNKECTVCVRKRSLQDLICCSYSSCLRPAALRSQPAARIGVVTYSAAIMLRRYVQDQCSKRGSASGHLTDVQGLSCMPLASPASICMNRVFPLSGGPISRVRRPCTWKHKKSDTRHLLP